ncbi:MAG: hypothetical protein QM791_23760 [Ferruginibacter sp.]
MAPAKENKAVTWIQTGMLALTLTLLSWIGNKINQLEVQIAKITVQMDVDHASVSEFRLKMGWMEDKGNDHEKRLVIVEALLPEGIRIRKRGSH